MYVARKITDTLFESSVKLVWSPICWWDASEDLTFESSVKLVWSPILNCNFMLYP